MSCPHCGKDHPPPTLADTADTILKAVRETSATPKKGAVVLALALGRLVAVCGLDLEGFLKVVREAHALSAEKLAGSDHLFPIRSNSWRC